MGVSYQLDLYCIVADKVEAKQGSTSLALHREVVKWAEVFTPLIRVNWGMVPTKDKIVREFCDGSLFLSVDQAENFSAEDFSVSTYDGELNKDSADYGAKVFVNVADEEGLYHLLLPQWFLPKSMSCGERTRLIGAMKHRDGRLALTFLFHDNLEVTFRVRKEREAKFLKLEPEKFTGEVRQGGYMQDILNQLASVPRDPEIWKRLIDLVPK